MMPQALIGLILTGVFIYHGKIYDDNSLTLPSRNPSIVLPVLEHLSITDDSAKAVRLQIDKILGEADGGLGGGNYLEFHYQLSDKTQVWVNFIVGDQRPFSVKLRDIVAIMPNDGTTKILYPR